MNPSEDEQRDCVQREHSEVYVSPAAEQLAMDFSDYFAKVRQDTRILQSMEGAWENWLLSQGADLKKIAHISVPAPENAPYDVDREVFSGEVKNFLEEMTELRAALPDSSPLRPIEVSSPFHAVKVPLDNGGLLYCALYELKNAAGSYLSFDGGALELCEGGPALVQICTTQTQIPYEEAELLFHSFFSQEAFSELLKILPEQVNRAQNATTKRKEIPYLLIELQYALDEATQSRQIEAELPTTSIYNQGEESEFEISIRNLIRLDDKNEAIFSFETDSGSFEAIIELDPNGLPIFEISRIRLN